MSAPRRQLSPPRPRGRHPPSGTAEQLDQLREAFATLSDVLVDELDVVRADAARRWELAEAHLNKHAQSIRVLRAEFALLRDEVHTSSARLGNAKEGTEAVERACERVEAELAAQGEQQGLARQLVQQEREEAARVGTQLEEKLRLASEALERQLARHRGETDAAVSALGRDVTVVRGDVAELRASSSAALDSHKDKLLQCATAIEQQWSTGRGLAQRCDSLDATQALIQQQLQDRLDSARKENARWRLSLEDALRSVEARAQAGGAAWDAGYGGRHQVGQQREHAHSPQVLQALDERDARLRTGGEAAPARR